MKLVLGVDAIFPPLTGIGRYALELATRLPLYQDIAGMRFLGMSWVTDSSALLPVIDSRTPNYQRELLGTIRRRISRYEWAVKLYGMAVPAWQARLLRRHADHLYHSPNYFLAPHEGPSVATVHDLSIYRYPETHPSARVLYFEREFRKTLDRADWLITDSEAVRNEVIDMFGWPAERITAVPLGVDASFHPRLVEELVPVLATYGLVPGQYTLCVSTLEPRKNIGRLLAAYGALPADLRKTYPLVLAGGRGWHDKKLLQTLDSAERSGWGRHLGYVPQSDLPFLYAGARATCFPSLYEGFGLPVLESMASGVPVLTSNCSCMPEVAAGSAWLTTPEDVDALREGMQKILFDAEWRTFAIDQGIKKAGMTGWEKCVAGTSAVYRMIMDNHQ